MLVGATSLFTCELAEHMFRAGKVIASVDC